jgi:hypothetical protein
MGPQVRYGLKSCLLELPTESCLLGAPRSACVETGGVALGEQVIGTYGAVTRTSMIDDAHRG